MSIEDRLEDAMLLWKEGRREGALLNVLVAVAATSRMTHPEVKGDRAKFEKFLKTTHEWTISVEHRGQQVDIDHLFYKWLRCELLHKAEIPIDIRIDDGFADPHTCTVRAGGAPEHIVLLTPGWYDFLTQAVRSAQAQRSVPTPFGQIATIPATYRR